MIDLIIPYYNNPEGLKRTLDSINTDVFYVTVVDDASFIYMPYVTQANQVFRYSINKGPGNARQYGIDRTHNPYIMFIDTGDVFISKEIQLDIQYLIDQYPESVVFSWLYFHKNELTKHIDNRLHGRVYKREFIDKYGLSFCPEGSYLNEDVGLNRACRLIIEHDKLQTTRIDKPVIDQIYDSNSITQRDNEVSLYRDQTRALSVNSIHEINMCMKNNIPVDEEITFLAIALYYWFIRTAVERPQYIQEAWSGARIFYNEYGNVMKINKLAEGNLVCAPFRPKLRFPINIVRFACEIQKNEIIPNRYLT